MTQIDPRLTFDSITLVEGLKLMHVHQSVVELGNMDELEHF